MPPTHQWRILVKHPESFSQPLPQPSCLLFLTSPQVQEHPKALQAEVALTLKVWENITDSALATILGQPLHTLSHIHSQLQTCVSPGSLAPPQCSPATWASPVSQQQPHSPHPLSTDTASGHSRAQAPESPPLPLAAQAPGGPEQGESGQGTGVCSAWEL